MEKIIETNGLTKYYPGGIIGIEDLSLSVEEGEIYGFLGANGAGKTTTIRLLVNLVFPTRGNARVFGKDAVKHHIEICKDIGYIPSSVRPHNHMTGDDFLNYMGKLSGNCDINYRKYLLKKFEMSDKDLQRKIKEYSTGMARKLALIQTFQHKPRLLIMDEPTEGLDPIMQHTFYELVKEYGNNGGTVFISSHHLLEVEQVCHRAAIIRNGKLAAVEKINEVMKCMIRTIQVKFKNPVDIALIQCDDWDIDSFKGTMLTAKIKGDIDKIIKLLSRFEILDISLPKPSLQDVFLDYYREEIP